MAISFAFFGAEIVVGFKTKSLALIADAFHYLNDIVAYVIAFIAAYLQEKGQSTMKFTYAFHRAELVGAFFNGVFLLALALSVFLQSIERFIHLEEVHEPILVLIVGAVGLTLNIISALVVHDHHGHGHGHGGHSHAHEGHGHSHGEPTQPDVTTINLTTFSDNIHASHNHTLSPPKAHNQHNLGLVGVLIHVLGDAVNNIGVMVAALIIWKLDGQGRFYADPAVSMAIALIIFASALPMTRNSGRILLEASPAHLDLEKIKDDLVSLPDVVSIHDLHVWHLSQSVILASLHVRVPDGTSLEQWEKTEQYLQHCFAAYGINHVTISPEIQRDGQTLSLASEENLKGCRIPSQDGDEYGCSVHELKKRRVGDA